jgi:hypothetical protein
MVTMAALKQGTNGDWHAEGQSNKQSAYRLCANYTHQNVCDWAAPIANPNLFRRSCRLTRVILNRHQHMYYARLRMMGMCRRPDSWRTTREL